MPLSQNASSQGLLQKDNSMSGLFYYCVVSAVIQFALTKFSQFYQKIRFKRQDKRGGALLKITSMAAFMRTAGSACIF